MKRFLCILISALLLFGAFAVCTASAEENSAELTLNGSEYTAEKGDKVTYTLEVESEQLIECAQFVIYYPSAVLKAESGALKNVSSSFCNIKVSGEINCNFSSPKNFDFTEKKELLVVEFSVISGGSGELTKTVKGFFNPDDKKITEGLETFEKLEVEKPGTAPEASQTESVIPSQSETTAETSFETVTTEAQTASTAVTESTEITSSTSEADTTAPSETAAETTKSADTAETTKATDAPETSSAENTTQPVFETSENTTAVSETEPAETTVETQPVNTQATDAPEKTQPSSTKPAKVKASFLPLKAKAKKASKKAVALSWSKVKNASLYAVYGCKAKGKYKKLKTVKTNYCTVKKLKKSTYYKFCIKALNGKTALAKSQAVYAVTSGSKYANPTSLKSALKTVVIRPEKSLKLKFTLSKPSGKKLKSKKVYFISTNTKVVSVSKKGKLNAKNKGTANVYAYASNGVRAMIKVKVK